MWIVLDTNVIVSALLTPNGSPAEVVGRWEADKFGVVTSPPLLAELKCVLEYPRIREHLKSPTEVTHALIKRLHTVATVVEPHVNLDVVRKDPADNRVLECAVAGGAAYIVTGNLHLLEIQEYEGILVLRPAEFLALLEALAEQGDE